MVPHFSENGEIFVYYKRKFCQMKQQVKRSSLKGNCGPEKPSDFFCLLEREKKIRNFAKNRRSKACLDQKLCHFLFFWWRHLWQTFGKRLFLPIFSILKWKWKVIKPVCSFQWFFLQTTQSYSKMTAEFKYVIRFLIKKSAYPQNVALGDVIIP